MKYIWCKFQQSMQFTCQQTEKKMEHLVTSDSLNWLQTARSYKTAKHTCHNFPPPPWRSSPQWARASSLCDRSYAPQSVGLLWTSDQPVAETSTWQHTTLTTDRHPFEPAIPANERPHTARPFATNSGISVIRNKVRCAYSDFSVLRRLPTGSGVQKASYSMSTGNLNTG